MEIIKHECGVALIRLRKPLKYYREKYGSDRYALDKLYLLMEKEHNRGQEAAGIGCVRLDTPPGQEYIYRERAQGTSAITDIFSEVNRRISDYLEEGQPEEFAPFIGEVYMGHLRYSTTGRSGINYVHPFMRRNNWSSRNMLLCGNFNMTNVDEIFNSITATGQHPRLYADTFILLEQLGHALDRENERLFQIHHEDGLRGLDLSKSIARDLNVANMLRRCSPLWDGGYVICGIVGNGDLWTMRDPNGIRPAFYYIDDEIVVIASERPVIQTVFNLQVDDVKELQPGEAIIVDRDSSVRCEQILPAGQNARCSFERIYFSRGSDSDIYRERKELGRELTPRVLKAIDGDIDHTVFSFIPNTAEVAFYGLINGLEEELDRRKADEILTLATQGKLSSERVKEIMRRKIRNEKVAIKDIKLRTFIAEGASRDDLATHVYDITYGSVGRGEKLVVIDDSIVRGTTLRQSILRILDRLHPKKIVVVSSSPQVRYPDCYGIDMSRLGEFIAFRAAMSLLKKRGMVDVAQRVYELCKEQDGLPKEKIRNHVKEIYAPFSDEEIASEIALLLTPPQTGAEIEIVFQTVENLHKAIPGHPGDWYFTGNYPTPGGNRLVNRAYINFFEGHAEAR
ncbi:MAG: amidophosphoribosyltransferase [Muribaculaceae bacterium]|nr:amidophosphoribosyltransferase [Muribaculaceae bacterium]